MRTKKEVVTEFREGEIIDAARRVIARDGPRRASMERIAEEAGISKGTLYLYFDSKDALVHQATERGHAEMARVVAEATGAAETPLAAIAAYVESVLRFCGENETLFRAMATHPDIAGSPTAQSVSRRIDEYVDMLQTVIERGIREGSIRQIDSRRVARFLVEAVRGLVIERLRDPDPPSVETDAQALVEIVQDGVAA